MTTPATTQLDASGRRGIVLYLAAFGAVLVLMALVGALMRAAQAGIVTLSPSLFYSFMTAHGIAMVGIAGLGGASILWYYLRQHVTLTTSVLYLNLICFLLGAVILLGGIFVGGFATGWTFLYPLPQHSSGQWGPGAAAAYLGGLLLIGAGFLIFYLDVLRGVRARFGSLGRAMGWPQLFARSSEEPPPATVVAATVASIVNVLALLTGATILVLELIAVFNNGFALDPLLAKNLTYFFGHVFINAAIYQSVIAIYEVLSRDTGRPWKASRPFLIAWAATLALVLAVYPHHFLMDFVMPRWILVMGQVLSYMSGFPVLLATAYGVLTIIRRSGIRWSLSSSLLVLSAFGWAAGVIPAIIDSTIVVNAVMHNTLWVPGHFHFYIILGQTAMVLAFANDLADQGRTAPLSAMDRATFWLYAAGGLGFVAVFLYSGQFGVPRRYAAYLPEWVGLAKLGALFGLAAALGLLLLVVRFFRRIGSVLAGPDQSLVGSR